MDRGKSLQAILGVNLNEIVLNALPLDHRQTPVVLLKRNRDEDMEGRHET